MIQKPDKIKLNKARRFLLQLSRGHVPTCPCSPYGQLRIDCRKLELEARAAYECLFYLMTVRRR